MRRSLRGTTALVTQGSPLHLQVPDGQVANLSVGGYMADAFDLYGSAGPAQRPAGPLEAFHCGDGEIYFQGDNILARLMRA